jgi:hypothetical protein
MRAKPRDSLSESAILFVRYARYRWGRLPPVMGYESQLPAEALNWLDRGLTKASVYVEYGAGASTLFAIHRARDVLSVESDRQWMRAVIRQVKSSPGWRGTLHALPVNIGFTFDWGYPVFVRPTPRRLRRWRRYVDAPWNELRRTASEQQGREGQYLNAPDVILIDGRFRVACVLQSVLSLPQCAPSLFLLDDYFNREGAYRAILPFTDSHEQIGRALAFRMKPDFDRLAAERARDAFLSDPL